MYCTVLYCTVLCLGRLHYTTCVTSSHHYIKIELLLLTLLRDGSHMYACMYVCTYVCTYVCIINIDNDMLNTDDE